MEIEKNLEMDNIRTILYVGIYPPTAPRDKVYLEELRRGGAFVIECVSNALGFRKYRELFGLVRRTAHEADLVWVGYLSVFAVPVVYLATRKKIVYNALGSAYEAYILDRRVASRFSVKAFVFWVSDFLAFHLADTVLVESEAQKKYLARQFKVSSRKLKVIYTGVDEEIFHPDSSVMKADVFTVAFRGMFIPATGVEVVLESAKLLRDEPIRFWISGWGQLLSYVKDFITKNNLTNVELNTVFLEPDDLRQRLLSSHVLLGQFSKNSRMERTIQHKTSEALALGMPFITRDSASNRELLEDGKNCLFVPPENPEALVEKILYIKNHPEILEEMGKEVFGVYQDKLSAEKLGLQLSEILEKS